MGNAAQRTFRRIKRIVQSDDASVRAKRARYFDKRVLEKPTGVRYTRILRKVSLLRNGRSEEERSPKGGGWQSNQERREERHRRIDALSILNTFKRWAEAKEWIKKQDQVTLEFVLWLITKFDEDASYTPTLEELGRLRGIHDAWSNEPPDWF